MSIKNLTAIKEHMDAIFDLNGRNREWAQSYAQVCQALALYRMSPDPAEIEIDPASITEATFEAWAEGQIGGVFVRNRSDIPCVVSVTKAR